MSKRAWMPLYIGDYLADTGHLSTTQHGAYLLLMMHYWRKGGLPDDDAQLSKIAKLPVSIWAEVRPTIQAFFHNGWNHKRIDEELASMMEKTEKRSRAGQIGGISSGIARAKLANLAAGRSRPHEAIVQQSSSNRSAIVNHSHSHKKEEEERGRPIGASPELLASLTKRVAQ